MEFSYSLHRIITQLLYAAQTGDVDKVYDLLQEGVDPNVRDEVVCRFHYQI